MAPTISDVLNTEQLRSNFDKHVMRITVPLLKSGELTMRTHSADSNIGWGSMLKLKLYTHGALQQRFLDSALRLIS